MQCLPGTAGGSSSLSGWHFSNVTRCHCSSNHGWTEKIIQDLPILDSWPMTLGNYKWKKNMILGIFPYFWSTWQQYFCPFMLYTKIMSIDYKKVLYWLLNLGSPPLLTNNKQCTTENVLINYIVHLMHIVH